MKTYQVIPILLAVLAGCQKGTTSEDARIDARQRWQITRANVLVSLGEEHLKVGQLDKAAGKVTEAVSLYEDCNDARVLLGRIRIEQGKYGQAIAALEGALQREPNRSEVHYLLGVAQEKTNLLDPALTSYRRAYELDPSSLEPIVAATEVLVAMNRPREAEAYIESFMSQADNHPEVYELAGRLAMMQKESARAVTYFQQACDLDTKNARYQEMLAKAMVSAGHFEDAVDTLDALTQRSEYECPTWVYLMLGDCHLAMQNPEKARQAFWVASERDSDDPGCWASLAKASLMLGDVERATVAAEQALRLQRNHLGATLVLGYAQLRSGDSREAIELLTRATVAHPDNSTIRCLLGRAHAATGNSQRAARCYAQALECDPDNELARRLLAGVTGKDVSRAD
jgi:tetratricopeptide (TPR) repeat protein